MITRWTDCSRYPLTDVVVLWINYVDIHRQDYPQLYPLLPHKAIQGLSTELPVPHGLWFDLKLTALEALSATPQWIAGICPVH